jgi:uncharacterized protein YjiS (DUF1127 family)
MVITVLASFGSRVAELRRVRRAYKELTSMTDLELEDMGIVRTDIPDVAAGTYFRERPACSVIDG